MAFIQSQKQPVSLHAFPQEFSSNFIYKTNFLREEEGQKRKIYYSWLENSEIIKE